MIQVISFYSCGQSNKGDFQYPDGKITDQKKADSIFELALDVQKSDDGYIEALLFRNEYGWQLGKVEHLKKDMPEILRQDEYKRELKYQEIFDPQKYPPKYWKGFYDVSKELKKHFEKGTPAYRENLAILTYLEILLNKKNELNNDLPELLSLINKKSDNYFTMLWQYGNLLISHNDYDEAEKVLEKGFNSQENKVNKSDFAFTLINLYSINNTYDKIIEYEDYIIKDTSGTLMFYLGEAHFRKGNMDKAKKYFEFYESKLQREKHSEMLYTKNGMTMNPVRPFQLEVLGDFYSTVDKEKSCEFYNIGIKVLSQPKNDKFFQKQLKAIDDPEEKKRMISNREIFEQEQAELLGRIKDKSANCN